MHYFYNTYKIVYINYYNLYIILYTLYHVNMNHNYLNMDPNSLESQDASSKIIKLRNNYVQRLLSFLNF